MRARSTLLLSVSLLLASAGPGLAGRRAKTISVAKGNARLAGALKRDEATPGIRRMIRKTLPRSGAMELVRSDSYGGFVYGMEDDRHALKVAGFKQTQVVGARGARKGGGREWTRRFVRSEVDLMAASFSPDGKRAVVKNEEATLMFQWRHIPLTKFVETARIREVGPGVFEVDYQATIAADDRYGTATRTEFPPGQVSRRLQIKLDRPQTLEQLWAGDGDSGHQLKQAIFEAARVRIFRNQLNAHVINRAYPRSQNVNQAWAEPID